MLRRSLALASALLLAPATAPAQIPGLTLTFTAPTGTALPDEVIDVRVRLALDPGAAPIALDGTSPATMFGLPPALFPAEGYPLGSNTPVPFASYLDAPTAIAHICVGGTFYLCPGGPYTFEFRGDGFAGDEHFTMLPGQSLDFLFGRYHPNPAPVPPGTYRFTGAAAGVSVYGQDANGTNISAFVTLARTCPTNDDSCAFTRTVLAATAPEPATLALLATGLAALALAARRRREA